MGSAVTHMLSFYHLFLAGAMARVVHLQHLVKVERDIDVFELLVPIRQALLGLLGLERRRGRGRGHG